MSGGVDSSVAAALLKRAGFEVVGVFMKNWTGPTCTAAEDFESAASAAAAIGTPLYSWNFEDEYRTRVFDYMLREYRAGRTPNPDVMCNKEIKFGVFFDRAIAAGADWVATGHYARTNRGRLFAGVDKNKDQSYFLWTLTQMHLARTLFPVGAYTKPKVRRLARKFGLPNADRKDSQGLCFVGKVDFREFLSAYVPARPGAFVAADGRVLGEHRGIEYYTVGQRHGIGIGGGTPYYVAAKDAGRNTVLLAEGERDPSLWRGELFAEDLYFIRGVPRFPFACRARIRYRQSLQPCVVEASGRVVFDAPQRAVASGQSVVFYRGDEVLGGGIIAR